MAQPHWRLIGASVWLVHAIDEATATMAYPNKVRDPCINPKIADPRAFIINFLSFHQFQTGCSARRLPCQPCRSRR